MTTTPTDLPTSGGGTLLRRLASHGVEFVFVNSGTDFPPLIEAWAEADANGWEVPTPVLVPHEHLALGMAHGHHLASGRAQAVILHTNVGLANGAIGAINAAADRIPVLIMSGRTPLTESGRHGSRTVPIGWGQEMRDQTALVRGVAKWDYELRYADQVPALVDRALAISMSTPKGPTYLSLPREPLTEACPEGASHVPIGMHAVEVRATDAGLAEVARVLAGAERPLIIAQQGAGDAAGFASLGRLASQWSIPVCQYWAVATAIDAGHPMYVGQDPDPWLAEADAVLVLDSLAPWSPEIHHLRPGTTVVQLGPDPLAERFPVRNFEGHLAVRAEVGPALEGLERAMAELVTDGSEARAAGRAVVVGERNRERRHRLEGEVSAGRRSPTTKAWAARCVGEAIAGRRATVLSELGCPLDPIGLTEHGSWRQEPHSGGLGWSFPTAMGMKLADPGRLVVATMGDGSYLFGNPVACHQTASAAGVALLLVVLNNGGYGAVRRSVLDQYPDGYAAKADPMPLVDLPFGAPLAGVAEACGVPAETVEDGDDLPAALARAIALVDAGTSALVEVVVDA